MLSVVGQHFMLIWLYIAGLVQERRNSIANALVCSMKQFQAPDDVIMCNACRITEIF